MKEASNIKQQGLPSDVSHSSLCQETGPKLPTLPSQPDTSSHPLSSHTGSPYLGIPLGDQGVQGLLVQIEMARHVPGSLRPLGHHGSQQAKAGSRHSVQEQGGTSVPAIKPPW